MITTDFLDKALLYISEKSSFMSSKSDLPEFTAEENKLLVRAFYKLEKDGYVYTKENVTPDGKNTHVTFYISFDGLLALENSERNKPYDGLKRKERRKKIWITAKTIAAIANAIIIILIGIFAVQAQRSANKINNTPTKPDTIYLKCDTLVKVR